MLRYCSVGIDSQLKVVVSDELPITGLYLLIGGIDKPPTPYCMVSRTLYGSDGNLNKGGMFSDDIYLCVSRDITSPPITDIILIFADEKEKCPPGYIQVDGNLNKNSIGKAIYLCYSTDTTKPAILDIGLVNSKENEICHPPYVKMSRSCNAGSISRGDIHICFKRAHNNALELPYASKIIDVYPKTSLMSDKLLEAVPLFCNPQGAFFKFDQPLPTHTSFVLTTSAGMEMYVVAVTFYEEYDGDCPLPNRPSRPLFAPKSICLLSTMPYFDSMLTILRELYRISISAIEYPLERVICNILETPFSRSSRLNIAFRIGASTAVFKRQPVDDLSLCSFDLKLIFRCLSLKTIFSLFACLLSERTVVLTSVYCSLLTPVAEAVRIFIFPFTWQYAFIPVLPKTALNMLEAPMPIFVGCHSSFIQPHIYNGDATIFDLDNDTIRICSAGKPLPRLPHNLAENLAKNLQKCARLHPNPMHLRRQQDLAFPNTEIPCISDPFAVQHEIFHERDVLACFLQFFTSLFANYREYLLFPKEVQNAGLMELFDVERMIDSQPKQSRAFLKTLATTQMFCRFIEHLTFQSENKKKLDFFDACCKYYLSSGKEQTSLIEKVSSRVFESAWYQVPPPLEFNGDGDACYSYLRFPTINEDLCYDFRKPEFANVLGVEEANMQVLNHVFKDAFFRPSKERVARGLSQLSIFQSFDSSEELALFLLRVIYVCWFRFQLKYIESIKSIELKDGPIAEVFSVLESMIQRGIVPDEEVFRCALVICGRNGLVANAKSIFDIMQSVHIQPSSETYAAYTSAVTLTTQGLSAVDLYNNRTSSLDLSLDAVSPHVTDDCIVIDWKSQVSIYSHEECPDCNAELFDEHIMNGWINDVGGFSTLCYNCKKSFIPKLAAFYTVKTCKQHLPFSSPRSPRTPRRKLRKLPSTKPTPLVPSAVKNHHRRESWSFLQTPKTSNSVPIEEPLLPKPKIISSYSLDSIDEEFALQIPHLSPVVVQREIKYLSNPINIRETNETLFWNMLWYFQHQQLPLTCILANEQWDDQTLIPLKVCNSLRQLPNDDSTAFKEVIDCCTNKDISTAIIIILRTRVKDKSKWSLHSLTDMLRYLALDKFESTSEFYEALNNAVQWLPPSLKSAITFVDLPTDVTKAFAIIGHGDNVDV